jgi:hypothetical protein
VGFSPETASGDGEEKMARHDSVPRRRLSSGGQGGRRRVLQQEERTWEVRRGPKGANDEGTAELTRGEQWHGGAMAIVWSAGADTISRKERRGRRSARRVLARDDGGGGKKRGAR